MLSSGPLAGSGETGCSRRARSGPRSCGHAAWPDDSERLRTQAGVPDASLHRLRHTVAVMLIADGKLLAAQHRLGHRELSTTLRHYGWTQAPDDVDVADHIDNVLTDGLRPSGG